MGDTHVIGSKGLGTHASAKPSVPDALVGAGAPTGGRQAIAPTPTVIVDPRRSDDAWTPIELLSGLSLFLLILLSGAYVDRVIQLWLLLAPLLVGAVLWPFVRTRAAGRSLVLSFALHVASGFVTPFGVAAVVFGLVGWRTHRVHPSTTSKLASARPPASEPRRRDVGRQVYRVILVALLLAIIAGIVWVIGPSNLAWIWRNFADGN